MYFSNRAVAFFQQQPWIRSAKADSILILAPLLIPVLVVVSFSTYFKTAGLNEFWWVALVLCIDVAHVYSTLFRFYWEPETLKKNHRLLILIPILAFLAGVVLYNIGHLVFWRILAYIAVFHFVRQQYGFMRLYSRKEESTTTERRIDAFAIYGATLYPLIWWHVFGTNKINWFVANDFFQLNIPLVEKIGLVVYICIMILYSWRELNTYLKTRNLNLPRFLLVSGTALSWYFGIVWFQGDLIFTMLNVVAHGIPYMALVWFYGETRNKTNFKFTLSGLAIFIGILITLAWIEEYFWAQFVWREHLQLFPTVIESALQQEWAILVVPALVVPQVTHYILDGYIWRLRKNT